MYQTPNQKPKGLIGLLIRWRIAANQDQAKKILIVVVIIGFLITIYLNRPGAWLPPVVEDEEELLELDADE